MKEESIFKAPAFIGYLIKNLKEKYPDKHVGKTVVQKMIYLLVRERIVRFKYSMYHYGPYSAGVSSALNFAENSGMVTIEWKEDKGYCMDLGSDLKNFENLLEDKEKEAINKCIDKFGDFDAIELSLIATAYFTREKFNTSDERLAEVVQSIKPDYSIDSIKEILYKVKIIKKED